MLTISAPPVQNPIIAPGVTCNTAGRVTGVAYGNGDSDAFTFDSYTLGRVGMLSVDVPV